MIEALLVSNLLLWFLVIVLAVVVVALTRQIGLLHERIAPVGALAGEQGPAVGEAAPRFELESLAGGPVAIGEGERTLLFFGSPTCPVCATLLPTLRRVVADESVRLVLASDGEPAEHRDYVRAQGLEDVEYVLSTELGLAFAVAKLPTAFLIDADGVVRAKGIVNTREHLESLFTADELDVASLQEHRLKVVSS
jgi:methylamine dehydrogenase accessory protein MauD